MSQPPSRDDPHAECIGSAEARQITGLKTTKLHSLFDTGTIAGHRVRTGARSDRHFSRQACLDWAQAAQPAGASDSGASSEASEAPAEHSPSPSEYSKVFPEPTEPAKPADESPGLAYAKQRVLVDQLLDRLLDESSAALDAARTAERQAAARHRTLQLLVQMLRAADNDRPAAAYLEIDAMLSTLPDQASAANPVEGRDDGR